MERSLRRKMREDFRHRSPTPPPSSRGVPHGASEATTESQLEAFEALRSCQEKISGPTAVPRVEGEETEARASWGTKLHQQGSPRSKSGQEQGAPYESEDETEEASDGEKRAPRRKKADTGFQGAEEARKRSGQKQEPPDEPKPKEKIMDATHRTKGTSGLALEGQ